MSALETAMRRSTSSRNFIMPLRTAHEHRVH
jgi:hypothetical protein